MLTRLSITQVLASYLVLSIFAYYIHLHVLCVLLSCLQCFDAVVWAAGRASGL